MANHNRGMSARRKMYLVCALCCAAVLLTSTIAFFAVRKHTADPAPGEDGKPITEKIEMVEESGYNKDENTIDTNQYASTILETSDDAGQAYINETLFLGDSNTARMYRLFSYCSYSNAIGSVGMSGRSLTTYACVEFNGNGSYVPMPQAVTMMQPKRVLITFGTNDLAGGVRPSQFVTDYEVGLKAIVNAYPTVDLIVNAIPPVGQSHSGNNLTQSGIDEANKLLVEMCQRNDWKFLNSAEVLKDAATGYAKAGYVEASDGIHLTAAAMDVLFQYIRQHSYITPDDRPSLTNIPLHTGDKDVVVYVANSVVNGDTVGAESGEGDENTENSETNNEESQPEQSQPESTPAPEATPEPNYTYTTTETKATCTEDGRIDHTCNEDPNKSYSEVIPALSPTRTHDFQNGTCTRCGAADPNYTAPTPEPPQETTPPPAEQPTSPPEQNDPPAAPANDEAPQA